MPASDGSRVATPSYTSQRYEMHLIGDPEDASKLVKLEAGRYSRKVVLAVLGR